MSVLGSASSMRDLAAIHDGIPCPTETDCDTVSRHRANDTGSSCVRYAHCNGKPRNIPKTSDMRVERMDHLRSCTSARSQCGQRVDGVKQAIASKIKTCSC